MFKKLLFVAATVAIFSFCCQVKAVQTPVSWDGGGDEHSWADANNWDPNIVPDNNASQTFVVTIDSNSIGVDEIEVGLRQSRDVNQVDCNGTVELSGDDRLVLTLEDGNGLRNYGGLEISGEFEISGSVTNYGYLELAEVEIGGNVTNADGAKLEFEVPGSEINGNLSNLGGGTVEVQSHAEIKQGDTENAGTVVIYPLGQMMFENQFRNNAEILIYGGSLVYWDEESGPGVLDNNSPGGVIKGFGVVAANQSIQNKGEIYAFGGSLAISIGGALINTGTLANMPPSSLHIKPAEDVNNQGTIQVHAGGGIGIDCNLVNEPNGTINLNGGTLVATTIVQKAGATFEGFGGISGDVVIEPNSVPEPNSIIKLTGPTNIVGDVNIADGATLEISDGTTLITGHTTCNSGTIHMIGGRIICQGGLTNNSCNIIWEPGTYCNEGDFNLDGTVDFKDFAYFAHTWLWEASWH